MCVNVRMSIWVCQIFLFSLRKPALFAFIQLFVLLVLLLPFASSDLTIVLHFDGLGRLWRLDIFYAKNIAHWTTHNKFRLYIYAFMQRTNEKCTLSREGKLSLSIVWVFFSVITNSCSIDAFASLMEIESTINVFILHFIETRTQAIKLND